MAYSTDHLPHTKAAKNASYNVGNLSAWWGGKKLSDVTAKNCRAYTATKSSAAARRDLETLRAAIGHWHREYGPLASVPAIVMPAKPQARESWLTRSEVARLLWRARRTEHLKRFILLAFYTGSRASALFSLTWDRIDFASGVMRRRGYGEAETSNKRTPPVRLGRRAIHFLRRWRDMDRGVSKFVVHWQGRKIGKLRRSWDRVADEARVSATPHTLRHTRATMLLQQGVDPWEVAGYVGMSLETLMRVYGHHCPNFQKRAAEAR